MQKEQADKYKIFKQKLLYLNLLQAAKFKKRSIKFYTKFHHTQKILFPTAKHKFYVKLQKRISRYNRVLKKINAFK